MSQVTNCVEPIGHTLLAVGLVIFGTTTSRASREPVSRPSSCAIRLLMEKSRFTGDAKASGLESKSERRNIKGTRTECLENIVGRELGRVDSS